MASEKAIEIFVDLGQRAEDIITDRTIKKKEEATALRDWVQEGGLESLKEDLAEYLRSKADSLTIYYLVSSTELKDSDYMDSDMSRYQIMYVPKGITYEQLIDSIYAKEKLENQDVKSLRLRDVDKKKLVPIQSNMYQDVVQNNDTILVFTSRNTITAKMVNINQTFSMNFNEPILLSLAGLHYMVSTKLRDMGFDFKKYRVDEKDSYFMNGQNMWSVEKNGGNYHFYDDWKAAGKPVIEVKATTDVMKFNYNGHTFERPVLATQMLEWLAFSVKNYLRENAPQTGFNHLTHAITAENSLYMNGQNMFDLTRDDDHLFYYDWLNAGKPVIEVRAVSRS